MKKIVSALTITALTLGGAFADISLSFTQKALLATDGTSFLDLNGYKATTTDCAVVTVSNDTAGVVFDVDPVAETKASLGSFDQYYGWMNFLNGSIKLQSGVWSIRNVNRMKTDAGQWENAEYEAYKPGVLGGIIGKDISNLTYIASSDSNPLSMSATYTGSNLFVTGAIVTSDYGKYDSQSGFAVEAQYKNDSVGTFNVIAKSPLNEEFAVGLFANPKTGEKLNVMGGFTLGTATEDSAVGEKYTEYGFDLRARYAFDSKMALTTMNNFSSKKYNAATNSVWDMLSVAYSMNEKTKLTVTGEWTYADLSTNNTGKLEVIPGFEYSPAKQCSVTAGMLFTVGTNFGTSSDELTGSSVKIPFILHVGL
jgi:hypothetical protein